MMWVGDRKQGINKCWPYVAAGDFVKEEIVVIRPLAMLHNYGTPSLINYLSSHDDFTSCSIILMMTLSLYRYSYSYIS